MLEHMYFQGYGHGVGDHDGSNQARRVDSKFLRSSPRRTSAERVSPVGTGCVSGPSPVGCGSGKNGGGDGCERRRVCGDARDPACGVLEALRIVQSHCESCRWEWFGAGRHFYVMRLDGVTARIAPPDFFLTCWSWCVAPSFNLRRVASSHRSCGYFKETLQCRTERASSPAPQSGSVERSIVARGASSNVWSLSHRFESVEGIIFAASGASGGNTRSAASGAWSLSRGFQGVEGITPASSKGLAAISWSSRQRARHTRSDLGVPCLARGLSLVGLDQPRNHHADHAINCETAIYVAIQDTLFSYCPARNPF